jgi:LmbE family N-acetylglucosaminyl deacetylase
MNLFLSPHPDDETLFGAFTLMREKPLVVIVTDSYVQQNRGENITPQQRFQESVNAMKILGCPVMRLAIRDDIVNELAVTDRLAWFKNFETVYAPAIQGGNPCHDIVGQAALKVFGDKVKQYSTYARGQWYTQGNIRVEPIDTMAEFKNKALDCYISQIDLPATRPHFDAVRKEMTEWYI